MSYGFLGNMPIEATNWLVGCSDTFYNVQYYNPAYIVYMSHDSLITVWMLTENNGCPLPVVYLSCFFNNLFC